MDTLSDILGVYHLQIHIVMTSSSENYLSVQIAHVVSQYILPGICVFYLA